LAPHYPTKSPLDDVLRLVDPAADEYVTEKYAFEITRLLDDWAQGLRSSPPALALLAKFLDPSLEASSLAPTQDITLRAGNGIEVFRRRFPSKVVSGRERFLAQIKTYMAPMSRVDTAEFLIVGIEDITGSSPTVLIDIRYDLVGIRTDMGREERVGHWRTRWSRNDANQWRVLQWEATEETLSRAREPIFVDITQQALGQAESYRNQMLRGVDHWRTVLDGACGIELYGNNGLAVGDFDHDGLDDLYVCQPSGLPNRLYRNRGDGTFEDVTEKNGVDVLDATACALFADFENKGLQDLLVVSPVQAPASAPGDERMVLHGEDSRRLQLPDECTRKAEGAQRVVQQSHAHPGPSPLDHRLLEFAPGSIRPKHVRFEMNVPLRRGDRAEHRWKRLLSRAQGLDEIPETQELAASYVAPVLLGRETGLPLEDLHVGSLDAHRRL